MSPFASTLKTLRLNRNLLQKDAADLLGYEQSYISGLENGQKSPPKNGFIQKLINTYQLNDQEQQILNDAIEQSRYIYKLPKDASLEAFLIFQALEKQITRLGQNEIQLIKIALGLEVLHGSEEPKM
jgi:transcriptional regulator with XRE-family HTH domain